MLSVIKPCKYCGSTSHYPYQCFKRPIKSKTKRIRKPIAKIGKQGKKTQSAVSKWARKQQTNHQGYYECYICSKWVTYLMTEHVLSKVRHPESRTDDTNFKAVCAECNEAKGSHDG